MNLHRILDADIDDEDDEELEPRKKSSSKRSSRSTGTKASAQNVSTGTLNEVVKYYTDNYPVLLKYSGFDSLSGIQNIWNESLNDYFSDVSEQTRLDICFPIFSRATISSLMQGLYTHYLELMKKSGGYPQDLRLSFHFEFGSKPDGFSIPLSCNTDSVDFKDELQDYYKGLSDDEKDSFKSKINKVTPWLQPVMFSYLSTDNKKQKRTYRRDLKKLMTKFAFKKAESVVFLVPVIDTNNMVVKPFFSQEHLKLAERCMDNLEITFKPNDLDLDIAIGYCKEDADDIKTSIQKFLQQQKIKVESDTTSEFMQLVCKMIGYYVVVTNNGESISGSDARQQQEEQSQEQEQSDSNFQQSDYTPQGSYPLSGEMTDSVRVVDAINPEDIGNLFIRLRSFLKEDKFDSQTMDEYKSYSQDLKRFSDSAIAWDNLKDKAKDLAQQAKEGLKSAAKKTGEFVKKAGQGIKSFAGKVGSKISKSMQEQAAVTAEEAISKGGVADSHK